MQSESLYILSAGLELFAALISLMLFIGSLPERENKKNSSKYFKFILISNFFMLIFDAMIWIGADKIEWLFFMNPLLFLSYVLGWSILTTYMLIVVKYISEVDNISPWHFRLALCVCALGIILWVSSMFNGIYFSFNDDGVFQYGSLYWVSQFLGAVFLVWIIVIVQLHRKALGKMQTFVLTLYGAIPLAAMPLQVIWEVTPLYLAITLSLVLYFITIHIDQEIHIKEQKNEILQKDIELSKAQTRIIISQMQPHFLYNTLTAIKHLCKINPTIASETVENFSYYLRGNMDALTSTKCASFEKEFEHLQTYLAIEKTRFGERLKITMDIKEKNFYLPALSVQPIVENAVKYGTTKKRGDVNINIATYSDEENYYIKITDDGVGFETNNISGDGRIHLGIENTRDRLKLMRDGKLDIESKIGKGTIVTITLPKNNKSS